MQTASTDGERTITISLVQGEDLVHCVERLMTERGIERARFSGEGSLAYAVLSAFDWRVEREYGLPVDGRLQLLSLSGAAVRGDGECRVDAHVNLRAADGRQYTGRLLEGYVHGAMELVLTDARVLPEAARARVAADTRPGARL